MNNDWMDRLSETSLYKKYLDKYDDKKFIRTRFYRKNSIYNSKQIVENLLGKKSNVKYISKKFKLNSFEITEILTSVDKKELVRFIHFYIWLNRHNPVVLIRLNI